MSKFGYSVKVDTNQPKIVNSLKRVGAYVLSIHKIKNAWDIIVFFRSKTFCMEIKNPESFPKKFWTMTEAEREYWLISQRLEEGENTAKKEMEKRGVKYHIVYSVDQAIKIITN